MINFQKYTLLMLAAPFLGGCQHEQTVLVPSTKAPVLSYAEGAQVGEILFKLQHTKPSEELNNYIEELGATLHGIFPNDHQQEHSIYNWYKLGFPHHHDLTTVANTLSELQSIEKVQFVHRMVVPTEAQAQAISFSKSTHHTTQEDPLFNRQWSLHNEGNMMDDKFTLGADIGAKKAWEKTMGDSSIIVAVLDYGVMYYHPDLIDNMWVNPGEELGAGKDADGNGYVDDKHGYNFVNNKGVIDDFGLGHGTHVAGIVSATNHNGIGVSSIAGGSGKGDGVRIMTCQLFEGSVGASTYDEARAIKYAADNGAHILQCSWGIPAGGFQDDAAWESSHFSIEKEALDYFIHNAGSSSGVLDGGIVIFAAGNENKPAAGYPGRHNDYLSVTSLAADNTPSLFTNYDAAADIATYGGDKVYHNIDERGMILSTIPPIEGNQTLYGYKEGTSMSCPLVSGVAALGLSYAAKMKKHYKAAEYKQMLLDATMNNDAAYKGKKEWYLINDATGAHVSRNRDLAIYQGKMGVGRLSAPLLLSLIEERGEAMRVPNVTMKPKQHVTIDLTTYLDAAVIANLEILVDNPSFVKATLDGHRLKLNALAEGVTTCLLKQGNFEQKIQIVVTTMAGEDWL